MKNTLLIASIAVRELIHERVFYLWMVFAGFSLIASLLLGQLTYAEQAKLTLDFMQAGIQVSMVLFAVFMGISMFQREINSGSIFMVLSKPVSRTSFLVGKYLGQIAVEAIVIFAMALLTILISLRFNTSGYFLSILQSSTLIFVEVAVLTAVTFCFAVNAGAVTAAIATFSIFCMGHLRIGLDPYLYYKDEPNYVWSLIKGLLPNLELFNMKALASYGHVLPWDTFGWALLYGLSCMLFFIFAGALTFQNKDLIA